MPDPVSSAAKLKSFMNIQPTVQTGTALRDAKAWVQILMHYRQSSNVRAIFEIAITVIPFVALWLLMWVTLDFSYFATLLLAVPTAGFLVRLFMLQHDCGHGSLFESTFANNWVGRIFGVLTFTPYSFWQHSHAMHHAGCGSLEHRGIGDIDTLTLNEYSERSTWGKITYRIYRNPITLFVIGPAYMFLLQHRLPVGMMRRGWKPWLSTMGTNLAIMLAATPIIWLIGFKAFLMIQLPIIMLAASIGVWLFYIQHQFEDTSWENGSEWDRHDAALHGSSHYDLPTPLKWLTGNIGVHHVHHLCSHIPFYKLPHVLRDHPELYDACRITLLESFSCVRLALWDQSQRKLITFQEARIALQQPA